MMKSERRSSIAHQISQQLPFLLVLIVKFSILTEQEEAQSCLFYLLTAALSVGAGGDIKGNYKKNLCREN